MGRSGDLANCRPDIRKIGAALVGEMNALRARSLASICAAMVLKLSARRPISTSATRPISLPFLDEREPGLFG